MSNGKEIKKMLREWNGAGEDLMGAALAFIKELETKNQKLEDEVLIVNMLPESSDEVFATIELTKEEHSQILRIGIMELIKMDIQK